MEVKINNIYKANNRIEVNYSSQGLEKYVFTNTIPYFEYGMNIENVPDSIAVIPFLCDILPLVFVCDVTVYLNELDKSFYQCIQAYRKAYQEMIPMLPFKGTIHVEKIVNNDFQRDTNKNALLFSGGIDATSSLCSNKDIISDCVTVWGSDVKDSNVDGWYKMSKGIKDIVDKFSKEWLVIRSNFRDILNEGPLSDMVKPYCCGWWHDLQHGIALLGLVAPLAFLRKYNKIYIASSFTKQFQPICASDPRTDSCFKVGNTTVIHDGFDLDRCEKVVNISDTITKMDTSVSIHVCWQDSTGNNCGRCEKCLRSYLNCRTANVDYQRLGIIPSIDMKEIKKFYCTKIEFTPIIIDCFSVYKKALRLHYGKQIPKDLKWIMRIKPEKVNLSFYWKLKRMYHRIMNPQR